VLIFKDLIKDLEVTGMTGQVKKDKQEGVLSPKESIHRRRVIP
jgi:hypothetical protein